MGSGVGGDPLLQATRDGDLLNAAIHVAFALPVGKLPRLGKEVGKEAVERIAKEGADDGGERVARDTIPEFKGTPGERLPRYDGGKTEGVITVDGQRYHVQSGYGKPSSELPLGLRGFNGNVKAHVAALMRQRNLSSAWSCGSTRTRAAAPAAATPCCPNAAN